VLYTKNKGAEGYVISTVPIEPLLKFSFGFRGELYLGPGIFDSLRL
jgi:hypothetical protein